MDQLFAKQRRLARIIPADPTRCLCGDWQFGGNKILSRAFPPVFQFAGSGYIPAIAGLTCRQADV